MNISQVVEIQLADIKLQGSNVRSDLDSQNSQENIKELADNIRVNGLLQPIILRGTFGKPPYDIVVGQRRFLAHQLLKEKTIKATFTGDVNDMQVLLISLSENMCRQEMNFEDMANAITSLYNYFGKDEYKVREHTGFSIKMIRNYVRIEEQASEKIKSLLRDGGISLIDAKRVIAAAQGDKDKADAIVDQIKKLTNYEKKRLVDYGTKNVNAKAEEIITEAQKPKLEESIILTFPLKVHRALQEASEKLSIDIESLTMNAVINWLRTNDFLIEN